MNVFPSQRIAHTEQAAGLRILLIVFVALATFYSLIIPLFEGPDEDDHFRYAKFISDHHTLPVQEFVEGGGAAGHQGWQPPLYYSLVALVISPLDTTDYAEHLWRNEGWAAVGDPACCGRNIYYHTENESFPFTGTTLAVHLARLVAVCFGAATVAATYALVKTFVEAPRGGPQVSPGVRVETTLPNPPHAKGRAGDGSDDAPRRAEGDSHLPGNSGPVAVSPLLPLVAAAVVAFNPSFLFASALVSNDTPLAAMSALALLLWVRLIVGKTRPDYRSAALLGALISLALLVKTSALALIPFSLLAFGIAAWRYHNQRRAILGSVLMLGVILLLAGWWFARNQMLYGDPLAYRLMTVSAIFERSGPLTVPELLQISLPWMWQTFWGGPTPGDFSPVLLAGLALLSLLACVGMVVFAIRNREFKIRAPLVLLAAWLGAILIAQVQFIRTTTGGDQGRYLFPAIPALGFFLALGLTTLAGRRLASRLVPVAVTLVFLFLALFVPLAYTLPAYARPATLTSDDQARVQYPMNIEFGNQLQLLGYDLDTRSVKPGDAMRVALYWRALAPMSESYRVFVHLIGPNDTSAGGVDVIPARGAFPTVYWRPGDTLRDVVTIPVAANASPGKYALEIGLYPIGHPGDRLTIGNSGDDAARVDVKVASREPLVYAPKVQSNAIFGDKIKLLGYDVAFDKDVLFLTLYWQGLARMDQNYKVFVHVLDEKGVIVVQQDRQPQDGRYPTSLWDAGEQVRDEYALALPVGIGAYSVEIGLYVDSGERLPVQGGDSLMLGQLGKAGQ